MGVRIIEGEYDGDTTGAVMICSTTMWAFGPVFDDVQECDCFQKWWNENYLDANRLDSIRRVSDEELAARFATFRRLVVKCRDCDEWTVLPGGVCEDCSQEVLECILLIVLAALHTQSPKTHG